MFKNKIILIVFLSLAASLLLLNVSQAAGGIFSGPGLKNITGGYTSTASNAGLSGQADFNALAINIVRAILAIVGIVFFILIIYGGFKWMTAGGNEPKIAEARKLIINAVIGLIIVSAAYTLAYFVSQAIEPPPAPPAPPPT